MEKKLIALVFIALLGGLGGGYGLGYTIYEPQLSKLQTSYDSLNTTLQSNVSSLQSDISNLQSQLTDLNTTYAELRENYTVLLTKYQQMEALVQHELPRFNIFDIDYNPGYSPDGSSFGGRWCKVYFNIQNFGNGTATNIEIDVHLELKYNEEDYIGDASTTLSHLEPNEIRHFSIKVEQELYSNHMQVKVYHFVISCQEGVKESQTLYPGD